MTFTRQSSLMRLLQLNSQSLPVGSFAYSQGLESAVDAGVVTDEGALSEWTNLQLDHCIGRVDLPILRRLIDAVASGNRGREESLARQLVAMRETRELRDDDLQRGRALRRLLEQLGYMPSESGIAGPAPIWPFARATAHAIREWHLPVEESLAAYAWSWAENQILAGVKLIPLGHVAGQRLMLGLAERIPIVCESALALDDDEIGGTLPIVAILSSRHETQYSRLFRS
ncbi:MAG: urease accessory protein UreF [Phycisphaerales bacterium]|nr:urease accessory protein UreF [Phycisphaerales bacterium]